MKLSKLPNDVSQEKNKTKYYVYWKDSNIDIFAKHHEVNMQFRGTGTWFFLTQFGNFSLLIGVVKFCMYCYFYFIFELLFEIILVEGFKYLGNIFNILSFTHRLYIRLKFIL